MNVLVMNVFEEVLNEINRISSMYITHFKNNYDCWPSRLNGNTEVIDEINRFKTQKQAADWHYNWVKKRFELLDSYWKV